MRKNIFIKNNKSLKITISILLFFCMCLVSLFSVNSTGNFTKNANALSKICKNQQCSNKNDQLFNLNSELSVESFMALDNISLAKNPKISFNYKGKNYNVKQQNNNIESQSTTRKKVLNATFASRVKILNFAVATGFSIEQAMSYAFPEIYNTINSIESELYNAPLDAMLKSYKNTGNIYIESPKNGSMLNKNELYNQILSSFNKNKDSYNFNINTIELNYNIDKDYYSYAKLRSSFKTYFGSSSESRKNNIKTALECFDGVVLQPNQSLSFNNTTGYRTEQNGYKKAKIIKNGTFVEEYGGGVCQVSTTLYNSALLSDLEIKEVHPHSLPVSYIEPCFDAMVNSGSSDLVIVNNTDKPIIFATSSNNDYCLVNIYGITKNYKVVRKSEKTEELLQITKEVTSDYSSFGLEKPLDKGESKIVSYGKPGYRAIGKLEYYENGVLIKTKQIRNNTYRPTKEVVLVG